MNNQFHPQNPFINPSQQNFGHSQLDWTDRGFVPNPNLQAPRGFIPNPVPQQLYGVVPGHGPVPLSQGYPHHFQHDDAKNFNTQLNFFMSNVVFSEVSKMFTTINKFNAHQSDGLDEEYKNLYELIYKLTEGDSNDHEVAMIIGKIWTQCDMLSKLINKIDPNHVTYIDTETLNRLTKIGEKFATVKDFIYPQGKLGNNFITESMINETIAKHSSSLKSAIRFWEDSKDFRVFYIFKDMLNTCAVHWLSSKVIDIADPDLVEDYLNDLMKIIQMIDNHNQKANRIEQTWDKLIKNKNSKVKVRYIYNVLNNPSFLA